MLKQKSLWMLGAVIVVALAMYAEDQPQKVIKHVPVKPTSAASGSEMYKAYCAVCHGLDGRGRGPAADALKVPPTDLTSLAKNNGGKYPALRVTSSVRGEANTPSHGTAEMPVWGHLLRSMSGGHDAELQQRVANLTEYIEGMQAK